MRTAVEYYGLPMGMLTKETIRAIKTWLDWLPDATSLPVSNPDPGNWGHEPALWTCHAVTRATKKIFSGLSDWRVVDGHFTKGVQHSWLTFEQPGSRTVLDVYPVASLGGPILVDAGERMSPWTNFYIEANDYDKWRLARFDEEAARLYSVQQHLVGETLKGLARSFT